jgi:hypothetical protein
LNFFFLFQKFAGFQEGIKFELLCRFYRALQVSQRESAKGLGVGFARSTCASTQVEKVLS